ncbi:MAG: PASTA domain-containing protein [Flavobacteriales bacterium]
MGFFKYLFSKPGRKIVLQLIGVYVLVFLGVWFYLSWYTDHGEQVSVPDLTGMTAEEAEDLLGQNNLSILVVDSIYTKNAKGGTILDQTPIADAKVKDGRQVFVTVYRKLPPQETINIQEGDFGQVAIIKLKNKGIDFDIKYSPNNSLIGSVVSITHKGKKVKSGQTIARGEKVVLTIGTAVDELVKIPNLQGLSYDDAIELLESMNLMGQGFFMYDIQSSSDSAVGRVCSQEPQFDPDAPGVSPGQLVDFRLYNTPCD